MARWHRSYDHNGRVWISPDDSLIIYSRPEPRGCLVSVKNVAMIVGIILAAVLLLCLVLGAVWAAFGYAAHSAMDSIKAPPATKTKVEKPTSPPPPTPVKPQPATTPATPPKSPLFDAREWKPEPARR